MGSDYSICLVAFLSHHKENFASAHQMHIETIAASACGIGLANSKYLRLVGLQPSEHLQVVITLDEGLGFGHGRNSSWFCNCTAKKLMGFQFIHLKREVVIDGYR